MKVFSLFILFFFITCTREEWVQSKKLSENPSLEEKIANTNQKWELDYFIFKREKKNQLVYELFSKKYNRVVWRNPEGESFISFGIGQETIQESRGSFFLREKRLLLCKEQIINKIEKEKHLIYIQGYNTCEDKTNVSFNLFFIQNSSEEIKVMIKVMDQRINRIYFNLETSKNEFFFGFGEQFTYFNLKGKRVPIMVSEQGIGRGEEPITTGANLTAKAGGDWYTTYAPVPYFITNFLRGFYLNNTKYSVFDLTNPIKAQIELFSNSFEGVFIVSDSPAKITEVYTSVNGRMRELPDWIHKGAIIGMQGGTEEVYKKWQDLKKYNTPISAFWLQDWVGQRKTSFGKQLWWNWELDEDRYPKWEQLIQDLKKENIQMMLYINPFLADVEGIKPNIKQNLFLEAKNKNYLIKNQNGEPYLIRNTDFYAGLIDLTNPEAKTWLKSIIKKNLIDIGAAGWMADFGEALPFDAILYNGDPKNFHNQYPVEWAKLNWEVIVEQKKEKEIVYFLRAGYTKSPKYSTLFWLGDQLVSWSEYDGIKTVVTGLVSSGLCGYVYNHSDIGGYTTITHWLKNYHRSKELFLRWTELSAFTSIFRTHEGNQPEKNHQFYSDEETLQFFSRYAKIYSHLFPYRKELIKEASGKGYPLVRPLFFHYPDDENVYFINYEEFLLGEDLLVAPVLDSNTTVKKVYLPFGTWIELWTGKEFFGKQTIEVQAPLGKIPVFYKKESKYQDLFKTLTTIN
ncbi:MAG: alpha-glucosidase [Leptonema sp. (in: bacteria)]